MTTGTLTDIFVVRPDRPQVRRMMALQGVVLALIVVLGVARTLSSEGWGRVASVVLYVVWFGAVLWTLVTLRRISAADVLAEIGPQGISVDQRGRRGLVRLPWSAVTSVRTDLWGRVVVEHTEGRKLLIVVRSSDAAANQVLAAVAHFSGGRL